jgi:hypothetical protein
MEKILSDIQLAEVDVRYYEILRDDAMRDRCHTLAYVWQGKVDEAKKALESLEEEEQKAAQRWQAEQEMQALGAIIDPDGLDAQGQEAWDDHLKNSVNPIELESDEYEAWIAGETRRCHENGLPFPVSGVAMVTEALEAIEEVDEDEQLESSALHKTQSQADQNYWSQCATEGYNPHDHDVSGLRADERILA